MKLTHPNILTTSLISAFAGALLILAPPAAHALTVPVAQDSSSNGAGNLTPGTGKAPTLVVTSKQTVLVRFDLKNLNVIPASIQPGNIKSAVLRLYVVSAKIPGDLVIRKVTSDWAEHFSGNNAALPSLEAGSIATVPAAELTTKSYINIDLTDTVIGALQAGSEFGFAIQTTEPKAKITLASKEGPATGYSAELEIEANTATDGEGNFTANTGLFSDSLSVSGVFVVEPHPLNAPSIPLTNLFVGHFSGDANTTGTNDSFFGLESGLKNVNGSEDTFLGAGAGFNNVSGAFNTFLGFNAGSGNISGGFNTCVGASTGGSNGAGSNNVLIGYNAGAGNTGNTNVYIGNSAGASGGGGALNVFVGHNAGLNSASDSNSFFGYESGKTNASGGQNAFFGYRSGLSSTANFNAFFGSNAGQNTSTGGDNSGFGKAAGFNNTTGSHNTFLGDNTGFSNTVENNNTFVGDLSNGAAGITNSTAIGRAASVSISNAVVLGNNCSVGIGTSAPNSMLQVNGSVSVGIRTNTSLLAGLTASDYVLINTTNNAGVVLPDAVGATGRIYIIKNRTSTSITVGTTPATETIDGATTLTIGTNAVAHIISDGANWFKIN